MLSGRGGGCEHKHKILDSMTLRVFSNLNGFMIQFYSTDVSERGMLTEIWGLKEMLWHWLNTRGTDQVDQVVLQGEAVCMANTRSKGQEQGMQFPQCSIAHTEEALKILSFLWSAWIPTGGICGSLFVYRTPSTREPCNYWPCNYTVRQVPHVDRVNKIAGYFFLSARERIIMRSYSCKLCSNYGFNN